MMEAGRRGGERVRNNLSEILRDCSDEAQFRFAVTCEACGRVWQSRARAFSKARIPPATEGKKVVYAALYRREQQAAKEAALREAASHFSRCPICRRWVCDGCFLLCEDLDMCRSCAERLEETGSAVEALPANENGR